MDVIEEVFRDCLLRRVSETGGRLLPESCSGGREEVFRQDGRWLKGEANMLTLDTLV